VTRAHALVAASHGTSSPEGRAAVAALVAAVRAAAPGIAVADAFVDVQEPDVPAVLDALGAGHETVVVPLLLSAGYHVHVDLVGELAGREGAPVLGAALGPDDRLVEVLVDRLAVVGLRGDDRVVLAAAGSSDLRAVADCRTVARLLSARLRRPVTIGFLSAARPSVDDAVARTKATHPVSRVVVASYLLAPGCFHDLAGSAGAHLTTAPILRADAAPPPALVELVLDRYRGAALSRAA
jgi:sirohydrochlorin ferrochelatase